MPKPVEPANRIDPSEITIGPVEEKDLILFAEGIYEAFPPSWWDVHEPISRRPSPEVRNARMAKRSKPWIGHPGLDFVKATIKSSGEIAGFAGWYKPATGPVPHMFCRSTIDRLGIAKEQGWTHEELDEMWEAVDLDNWEKVFDQFDTVKAEEMKDRPHWYLAPFFVFEQHRGRGIGSLLLKYASDQADASTPSLPCYLEALPDARPVYSHHGYVGLEGPGRGAVMVRWDSKLDQSK